MHRPLRRQLHDLHVLLIVLLGGLIEATALRLIEATEVLVVQPQLPDRRDDLIHLVGALGQRLILLVLVGVALLSPSPLRQGSHIGVRVFATVAPVFPVAVLIPILLSMG